MPAAAAAPAGPAPDPYHTFGQIVCITLADRPDRRAHAEASFRAISPALARRVRFFVAQRHPGGGIHGCFDSHVRVVRAAYDAGVQRLLVFEDDVRPTPSYADAHVAHACRFMDAFPGAWDIFYLGYFPINLAPGGTPFVAAPAVPHWPHIVRYNALAAHALVYSRAGMERALATYEPYIGRMHYDIYLARYANITGFCYTPMLFDQHMCLPSDIGPANRMEAIGRRAQCLADRSMVSYRVSLWKDLADGASPILAIAILMLLLGALLVGDGRA